MNAPLRTQLTIGIDEQETLALIEAAQSGNMDAFAALFRSHHRRIYTLCLRMTGDTGSAEDLTQDTFVQAWRSLSNFRGGAKFSTWLHRIAVNTVTSHGRRHPANFAIAATLLISVGFSFFGWQAYRSAESERAATAAMITALLAPYEQTRAETATRWLALNAQLDPEMLSTFTTEREKLDAARALLMDALHKDPADPALHQLMQQVMGQETELIESGTRVSGYAL